MSDQVITVENLSKAYRIGALEEAPDTLMHAMAGMLRAPLKNFRRLRSLSNIRPDEQSDDILWALRNISFHVDQGEVVGIIGRNGAGKSTLLKVLSRITEPTSGRAVIRGRVSSLLEVGTGFHPELTGRENVYMNGTILGMTKREIDRKFDEIVAFSGVEKFLDTPSKRYSSGMQVRLAFAVAAHLEPEILIIDEVLAVGDAEFQKKCLGKMQDVAEGGRTVLFVSHNMAAVKALCSRTIHISGGCIDASGKTDMIIAQYLSSMESESSFCLRDRSDRIGSGIARFSSVKLVDKGGNTRESVPAGEDICLRIELQCSEEIRSPNLGFVLSTPLGVRIFRCLSSERTDSLPTLKGDVILNLKIQSPALCPGQFRLLCSMTDSSKTVIDRIENAATINISEEDVYGTGRVPGEDGSLCFFPTEWELCSNSQR